LNVNLALVRDIAIVVLALESIVIGIVLVLMLWQVRSLTRLLQDQLKPMLDSMRETVGTVKGTTSLVSETIVTPAVKIGGFFAGARRALQVMLSFQPRRTDGGTEYQPRRSGTPLAPGGQDSMGEHQSLDGSERSRPSERDG
jgi:hypothetical protein